MTRHPSLEQLKADNDIYTAVALIVSPWPIYDGLKRNQSVQAIAHAWRAGLLTPEMVEDFVKEILRDFQPRHHFQWEHVLCGLAVAMETCDGELPERLLNHIARLQLTETPMAHYVAALCLDGRTQGYASHYKGENPEIIHRIRVASDDHDYRANTIRHLPSRITTFHDEAA